MKTLPKAIMFDADGTLYDSSQLHFEAYQQVAHELYDFLFEWNTYKARVIHGDRKPVEVLREHVSDVDEDHFQSRKRALYEIIARERLQPMPGLSDFLAWCKDLDIRCFVVSAASRHSLQTSLEALKVADYFEAIVGHEDVGDKRKPHPYPYSLGLSKAGLTSAQAIAIEDAPHGITAAQLAGLRCIGIRNQTNSDEDLEQADHIVDSYDQFKTYLLQS